MMRALKEEWWLDATSLPKLCWARFKVYGDHHIEVFDLDGRYHDFRSERDARNWLQEDEYERLEGLIKSGELPASTRPPAAANDHLLVPKMRQTLGESSESNTPMPPARQRRGLNIPLLLAAIFIAVMVVALKNAQVCHDEVRINRIKYRGAPLRAIQHLPCEFRCCGDSPWACSCSAQCPCFTHPAHVSRAK